MKNLKFISEICTENIIEKIQSMINKGYSVHGCFPIPDNKFVVTYSYSDIKPPAKKVGAIVLKKTDREIFFDWADGLSVNFEYDTAAMIKTLYTYLPSMKPVFFKKLINEYCNSKGYYFTSKRGGEAFKIQQY